MQPGELNRRIELQQLIKEDDGQGGYNQSYLAYATVWAKIEPNMARNVDEFEQIVPELTHRITIRYRQDVAATDRIKYGMREFEQIAPPVNVRERNAYLELLCREVVASE